MLPHDVFIQEQLEHDARSLGLRASRWPRLRTTVQRRRGIHGSGGLWGVDDLSELTGALTN